MKEPKWVPMKVVLSVHERMLSLFGGDSGVRDFGLLESALTRPKNVYHYESDAPIERLAASYAHGIAMNHPFLDGNKRTAFTVASIFLGANGRWLSTTETEAANMMISLAAGELAEAEFALWLTDRCVPLNRP